jgi:hypothetical protein
LSEIAAEEKGACANQEEMTRKCCRAGGPLFQFSIAFIFFYGVALAYYGHTLQH